MHLVNFRRLSGNRKLMRLKSALEDFEANTLRMVPGLLRRLSYLGRLYDGRGARGHWGLAKVYGEDAAQQAIYASYRVLLSEVLRKPLAVLLNELSTSCSSENVSEKEFLTALAQSPPTPLSRAARAHLGSVLGALSALVESRNSANLRGASPPRPPVQEPRPPAGV